MVQVYTLNGVVGTMLTESDLQRMIEISDIRGKKKYFIPCKKSCRPVFEIEEIKELLLRGVDYAEIAQQYGKSTSWLKYKLIQVFGTSSAKNIISQIKDSKN